jgi:hypothetical protein
MWKCILLPIIILAVEDKISLTHELMINGSKNSIREHLQAGKEKPSFRYTLRNNVRLYQFDVEDYMLNHYLVDEIFYEKNKAGKCWKECKNYTLDNEYQKAFDNNDYMIFKTKVFSHVPAVVCVIVGIMQYEEKPEITQNAFKLIQYQVNKKFLKTEIYSH